MGSLFCFVAERVRFELTDPVKGLRFSRPVQSATLPPLRKRNDVDRKNYFLFPTSQSSFPLFS